MWGIDAPRMMSLKVESVSATDLYEAMDQAFTDLLEAEVMG
jgi:hypothetical protein